VVTYPLHLTRAFGAPGIAAFLHMLVGFFTMAVLQTRRGQVSFFVGPHMEASYDQ